MCTVLEVIGYYIIWFLEKINYLTPYQNGLRKNHSTYDNLNKIKVFNNKKILRLAILNITQTNKVIWRHYILSKLNKVICPGNILNFLKNRSLQIKMSNQLSLSLVSLKKTT